MSTFMANAETAKHQWFVIDATDQVVGRLAVTIANLLRGKHKPEYTPHCDTGDFVIVVNAEKVKFTGKKWDQKTYQTVLALRRRAEDHPGQGDAGQEAGRDHPAGGQADDAPRPAGYKQITKLKIYAGPSHDHQAQQPDRVQAAA